MECAGLLGGFAGFDLANHKALIYGTGNNLSCWTTLSQVATAVVNMLRDPTPVLDRGIFVAGVKNLTQNTLKAALEVEMAHTFDVVHVDIRKIRQDAFEALERGDLSAATKGLALNSNFNEEDSAANFWDKVENDLVGVEALSVQEAVKETLKMRK